MRLPAAAIAVLMLIVTGACTPAALPDPSGPAAPGVTAAAATRLAAIEETLIAFTAVAENPPTVRYPRDAPQAIAAITASPPPAAEPGTLPPLPASTAVQINTPAVRPTAPRPAVIQPGATIANTPAVPLDPPVPNGFLWWQNDRRVDIFVTSPVHQQVTDTQILAEQWVRRNEACLANAGATYILEPAMRVPKDAVGIQVTSGRCQGFQGWVFAAALHSDRP
jgi:hypothetical protein